VGRDDIFSDLEITEIQMKMRAPRIRKPIQSTKNR